MPEATSDTSPSPTPPGSPAAPDTTRSPASPASSMVGEGVVRGIDWKAAFPALHLFRAFRIAIHPSKLLLALVFLYLILGVGRGLDLLWPTAYRYPAVAYPLTELPSRPPSASGGDLSGPFDVLLTWQLTQLQGLVDAVIYLNLHDVPEQVYNLTLRPLAWTLSRHPVFATLFGSVLLLAWAIFGGAIARIAAVHVARDEKISMRNALRFASGKLLSFLFAPVILFLFIGGLGFAIAVTHLVFYLPWGIGPALAGFAFVLTLLAALVMTLALFGTLGGFGLMYPTIAVEGTDAFDAISRSFSYFFARPWKLLFYSLIALVYGSLTYLFLKLFIFVLFTLIQAFQVWFLTDSLRADYRLFFPPLDFRSLSYTPEHEAMSSLGLKVGASVVNFWFHLVVYALGAYAVSFFISAQTIIYYLLRLDVDVTELDDVYLEEADEDDIAEQTLPDAEPRAAPAGGPAATTAAAATPPPPDHHDDPPTVGPSGPLA
ncbi:MAG: hypothetical protein ACK4PI_09450 [Tepidisphaerales bacterium]